MDYNFLFNSEVKKLYLGKSTGTPKSLVEI